MRLGFIGLGAIGGPMCRRLVEAGLAPVVYDARPEAVQALVQAGATGAGSPAGVGAQVDVLLLSLPDETVVRSVLLGPDGAGTTLAAGSVVVDLSSAKPLVTRQTAAELVARAITLLDAPVSGGVVKAKTGELTIMVGGDPAAFARVQPVLAALGKFIVHVGAVGAGHTAKCINNLINAAILAATAEGVILGAKAGLDPATLVQVINQSTGRSHNSEFKFPRFILNRRFNAGFAAKLMYKDVGIAHDLADHLHVPLVVGSAAHQLWNYVMARGGGEEDHTAIVKYLEQWSGVQIGQEE